MVQTSSSTSESWDFMNMAYKDCPLTALSRVTTNILSNSLNNLKIIHSDNGYERDWRGLATLSEQRSVCGDNPSANDPFERVVKLWCENKPETATFGNLIMYLGIIDRWHIIEDIHESLLKDYQAYQVSDVQQREQATTSQTVENFNAIENRNNTENQENTIVHTCISPDSNIQMESANLDYDFEAKLLTSNDVQCYQQGLPLEQYDAFLLYADADYKHALEILKKLQNNRKYNFSFCLKDDLLFGIPFEHIALMELIRERCKYLIAILTKEFTKSPENRFFVNYAQALQIKQEIRKVIPLLYEDNVEIPANLAMFSRMRYNPHRTDLYWSKLADSMQLLQLNNRIPPIASPSFQYGANNRRLQSGAQQRNLAIEASDRVTLPISSQRSDKPEGRKKPTTRAKQLKTKGYIRTSFHYSNQTDSTSITSKNSYGNSKRSKSFLKRLICCNR